MYAIPITGFLPLLESGRRQHACTRVPFPSFEEDEGRFVGTDDPSLDGWVAFYRNERIGVARPPCYSILRFASCLRYNRTRKKISVGSVREQRLRDLFTARGSLVLDIRKERKRNTSMGRSMVESILKKDEEMK